MKILLIETDAELGSAALALLREWKMDAMLVREGREAWKVLSASAFDLLITDLVLSDMKGIKLVRRLRQTVKYKNLPVLILTGKVERKDVIQASQLGISGFVVKPPDPVNFKKKIMTVFKSHQRLLALQQIKQLWEERTTFLSEISGPQIILGEPVDSIEELRSPSRRELVRYLSCAREVIAKVNSENPDLKAGYIIEHDTMNIVVYLKKLMTKRWVKLILLSTECYGNPTLIVRLFAINRKDDLPIFLVYKHADDIPSAHRAGLKKLGIKIVNRSSLERERIQKLIDRYLLGKREDAAEIPQEERLSPAEVHSRITADIETMVTLPPLPQVYERILSLSKDPHSKLKEWAKVIRVDPMTSASILQHANSLSYGFKEKIAEVDRAVILLGKDTVAGLVASDAVRQTLTAVQEKGFILEDFWLHNLSVGFAAYILSFPLSGDNASAKQGGNFAALGLSDETVNVLKEIDLPKRLKLDYARENPFVGGIMHDIGKGIMAHSYPGLFPLLCEELKRNRWSVPMSFVEQEVAGGLTHTVAGEILMRKWGMDERLCDLVLHHHQPGIDDTFTFLIGISDIVGQILYPFPREAEYPLAGALEKGTLREVSCFVPEGFFEQPLLSVEEFTALAGAIAPRVKYLTEKMRLSVN